MPTSFVRGFSNVLIFVILLIFVKYSCAQNLVRNGDFEFGLKNWHVFQHSNLNSIGIVDESVKGNSAIKLSALVPETPAGKSMGIHSEWVSVKENTLIDASAWVKASSIVRCGSPEIEGCRNWHNFRITLTAFDANNEKVKPKGHWDLVSTDGEICGISDKSDCGWTRIRASIVTPPGTEMVRLEAKFTSSTGVAWLDDMEIRSVMTMPESVMGAAEIPALHPEPAYLSSSSNSLSVSDKPLVVMGHARDPRLLRELRSLFPSLVLEAGPESPAGSRILFIGPGDAELEGIMNRHFPDRRMEELGEEGYFMVPTGERVLDALYIASNTVQGAFYALQSLKQLYAQGKLISADVWDYPEVNRRGIAMGLHWFKEGGHGRVAIDRLAERKGNMIWNQGSYMGGKFTYAWREPFTPAELRVMKDYLMLAHGRFIDVHLSFGPRTRFMAGGCSQLDKYPAPVFSSRREVELLIAKIRSLYEIGYRNFGLNLDDLEHCNEDRLRHQVDMEAFSGDIGRAHVHFANEIYRRVREIDPDIGFMMIPLWYASAGNYVGAEGSHKRDYLLAMRGLDPRIELHSVQTFDEDFAAFRQLTGRPTFLWTNYFSLEKDADLTMPWVDQFDWDPEKVTGFVFLPAPPDLPERRREDQALVSWDSALGYAWAPGRYDPARAFAFSSRNFTALATDNGAPGNVGQ